MIRLTVRENATTRTVRFDAARIQIGSGSGIDLRLEGAGIAARHCLLRALRRGFEVVDLRSREGTILNGRRVARAAVRPGDTLVLGSSAVILDELAAEPGAPRSVLDLPAVPPPEVPDLRPRAPGPAPAPGFDELLFRAVRGSPPLLLSIGLHAAAALALWVLAPEAPRAGTPDRSLRVEAAETAAPLDRREEPPERPELPSVPSPEAPLLDPEVLAPRDPVDPREEPPPPRLPPEDLPVDLRLGFGGPIRPPRSAPVDFDANPSFDGEAADSVNREAAGKLVRSLGRTGSGDRSLLKRLDPRRILVVRGTYDRVEDILTLLGIGHDTLLHSEIANAPLPPEAILIIDCGQDALSPSAAQRVREFVHAGGYLCTTDWGLENVIEVTFPGVLRSLYRHGDGVSTQNEVVAMTLPAPADPLVRGLRAVAADSKWWVEDRAHPVKVVDAALVTVLAESPEFRRRYGSGVLAAVFPFGRGRVLHLLGHAWQKEGNLKGTYAMQRLLLNFLLARAASLAEEEADATALPRDHSQRRR